jgi:hypothetical protein
MPAFSPKSKVAFPKTEVLGKPQNILKLSPYIYYFKGEYVWETILSLVLIYPKGYNTGTALWGVL